MIIDIIINKNPDGFCINEKVKKDILKNGNQLYNDKVVKEFAF